MSAGMKASGGAMLVRYSAVGLVGTALQYLVVVTGVQWLDWRLLAASTAGAILGALVNYVLNRSFTFASDRPHRHAMPRFAAIAIAGILINAAVVAILAAAASPAHYLVIQAIATAAVLVFGFLANRRFTF
jgi:putative flippase GtrA